MPQKSDRVIADSLEALIVSGAVEAAHAPVQRFETHLSHVLLAGQRAFKLKKHVRMPFVDFSTLEGRHQACLAEVDINRRMGSPLYIGALAVEEQADGELTLGSGRGTIIDWAVVMQRFDTSLQFDHLAEAGRLDDDLARRTADRIADMHAGLTPQKTAGHTADYRKVIADLRRTEADGAEKQGLAPGHSAPFNALDSELTHIDPLIEARRKAGKVRRTHGDLHLRNICLHEGEVTPFDALEFDDRLATTDVLYDLAFLLMDLKQAGLERAANTVMNRYWDTAGEAENALQLLPFFMALRAAVRMSVAVEGGKLEEANAYRTLAGRLLSDRKPILVAVGGLSGTGKSTVAAALAPCLPGPAGARLLRTDVLRKAGLDVQPETGRAGKEAYTAQNRSTVYESLGQHAESAHAAGASVLADATFQDAAGRQVFEQLSGDVKIAFWLEAPLETRLRRVAGREKDASDADVSVARAQREPETLSPDWVRIDADRDVEAIVADCLAHVESKL